MSDTSSTTPELSLQDAHDIVCDLALLNCLDPDRCQDRDREEALRQHKAVEMIANIKLPEA